MGNRAVITTKSNYENNGVGIYLHWNGGRTSVEGFLKYCKLHGYRSPKEDGAYAWAMLTNIITNFFGDGMSCGIDTISNLDCDNGDNGVYFIDGWDIVGRKFNYGEQHDVYTVDEFVKSLDENMPVGMQLGSKWLEAEIVPTSTIKICDKVFLPFFDGDKEGVVIGFGNGIVNGSDMTGVPYTNICPMNGHPEKNINNYLRDETVRKIKE